MVRGVSPLRGRGPPRRHPQWATGQGASSFLVLLENTPWLPETGAGVGMLLPLQLLPCFSPPISTPPLPQLLGDLETVHSEGGTATTRLPLLSVCHKEVEAVVGGGPPHWEGLLVDLKRFSKKQRRYELRVQQSPLNPSLFLPQHCWSLVLGHPRTLLLWSASPGRRELQHQTSLLPVSTGSLK